MTTETYRITITAINHQTMRGLYHSSKICHMTVQAAGLTSLIIQSLTGPAVINKQKSLPSTVYAKWQTLADYSSFSFSSPIIIVNIASTMETSGKSNLTQGRIAAAHGWFSRIRQMAPICTPYIESQKMVAIATTLRHWISDMSSHHIAWPQTYP